MIDSEENGNEEISEDLLRKTFPPKQDSGSTYTGQCSYCKVEIDFPDISAVKIIKNSGDLLLYHNGCYERYLRRTID